MGCWKYRAVSLVMIVALAGTPAVAAACAALCLPAIGHDSSMATADNVDHHANHGAMPAGDAQATTDVGAAQASGHHHSVAVESDGAGPASREPAVAVVAAADLSCCASDGAVLTASVATVRVDTGALLATAVVLATPFHSLIPVRSEPNYSPPIAPPSPTRAPLVLRV